MPQMTLEVPTPVSAAKTITRRSAIAYVALFDANERRLYPFCEQMDRCQTLGVPEKAKDYCLGIMLSLNG
jgi:hypothetical protein